MTNQVTNLLSNSNLNESIFSRVDISMAQAVVFCFSLFMITLLVVCLKALSVADRKITHVKVVKEIEVGVKEHDDKEPNEPKY
jgi:hypothetical protein